MGEFQEAAAKVGALIALVASIFVMGNSVSDPSSLIEKIHGSNIGTASAECAPRHRAGHYKTLAYDIYFIAASIVLSAGLVYAVKMTADAAAKAEGEARETEAAAASVALAENLSSRCAQEAEEKDNAWVMAQADANHAKLVAQEKRSVFNKAVLAVSIAETEAITARQALQAATAELETSNTALQQARNTPRADVIAAENNALAAAKAADEASTTAVQAREDAAKATRELQPIIASLEAVDAEAERQIEVATAAKTAADAAKKIADDAAAAAAAAKPAVGIARLPGWKRVPLRFALSSAILIALYCSHLGILSFRELLKYKTECLEADDLTGRKVTIVAIAVPVVSWLLGLVFLYLHVCFLVVAIWKN